MKKCIFCVLLLALCLSVVSCSHTHNTNSKNTVSVQNDIELSNNISTYAKATKPVSENVELSKVNGGEGGGEILPRKYRNNYYQIPTFFAKIIDSDVFSEWEKEYYSNNYADDTNVMVMVAYIKEFDISREDFDRANLEYAKFIDEIYSHICLDPQDYADQEFQEIYNTEIIYTFDNDIINEYYLGIDYPFLNEYQYDEAIANGTYQTRTTEFITLEQMEADIIAKYGETEIVTKVTETTTPEETDSTDLSQIETNE